MPEKFLNRADVIIRVQQMRRKAMSHHVRRHPLIQLRLACRQPDIVLERRIQNMVPTLHSQQTVSECR